MQETHADITQTRLSRQVKSQRTHSRLPEGDGEGEQGAHSDVEHNETSPEFIVMIILTLTHSASYCSAFSPSSLLISRKRRGEKKKSDIFLSLSLFASLVSVLSCTFLFACSRATMCVCV